MIAFNLMRKGGIILKACGRTTEHVIIRPLRFKNYPASDISMAWIRSTIIQTPKIAVTIPTIVFIIITSFLHSHICACCPPAVKMLAQLIFNGKCKTTQLARHTEVI